MYLPAQLQLPRGVLPIAAIPKHAPVEQDTMSAPHHATYVAAAEPRVQASPPVVALFNCGPHGGVPHVDVGLIEAVDFGSPGNRPSPYKDTAHTMYQYFRALY